MCPLQRSVGGEFDNEAVAVTAICSTFWLLGDPECKDQETKWIQMGRVSCRVDDLLRWLLCVRTPAHWPISIFAGANFKM